MAGILGAGSAEVTLRAPPPLETELTVERDGDAVRISDGDTLVAEGRPAEVEIGALPEPVEPGEAQRAIAAGHERWTARHPFPTCFGCGPRRPQGDGLDIFPAETAEGHFVAQWTPRETNREIVWAALDCPTAAPLANYGEGPPLVLARLAASIDATVRAGEPHALVSWEIARDGRKREAACVLFDADGEVLARSRALWIELRQG